PSRILVPSSGDTTMSTRRTILAGITASSLSGTQSHASATSRGQEIVEALVRRAADGNAAFTRGDMKAWSSHLPLADDILLMAPFGGQPSRGFESSDENLAKLSRNFTSGTTSFELLGAYVADDLVVLAAIERQVAEVGGLPEQDWSLRVTLVFRRRGSEWLLAHRHADPLVRHVGLAGAAEIARGMNLSNASVFR
ncbi:YybH family protein, partial [Enterovirga sp. CN4-39]|uniref:YybH family protein n=1 Tax=Enterovirga sp. CN4-39 TaxID=3400910 RepID=UPI003C01492A